MYRWFFLLMAFVSNLFGENTFSNCLLISGSANPSLAEEVAKKAQIPYGKVKLKKFNDGEINIQILDSIRGKDVFILQPTCSTIKNTVNDHLIELYLLIRTCRRSSAKSITAIVPYFGYARQDRKTKSRVPISASDIAMMLEAAGVDHVMAIDLHCGQIQGFFRNVPVDNLQASTLFVPYLSKKELRNPVVISPDAGGVERAKKFAGALSDKGINTSVAIIVKQRPDAGIIGEMDLVGTVLGSDVIIIDDICDTAGTLCRAAKELKFKGAKRVFACITHPVFSSNAIKKIEESAIDELVVTDTIPFKDKVPNKIIQIPICSLLAEAIEMSYQGRPMSSIFLY